MLRKATKTTRGPNSDEKHFQRWLKNYDTCGCCGLIRPLIMHHCEGSTFKHNKILCGHYFCIGICLDCDNVVTHGSRREFRNRFGPQALIWLSQAHQYMNEQKRLIPSDVFEAIKDWGK